MGREAVIGAEVGVGVGNDGGVAGGGSGDGTVDGEGAGTAGRSVDVSGEGGVGSLDLEEQEGACTEGGPVTASPD